MKKGVAGRRTRGNLTVCSERFASCRPPLKGRVFTASSEERDKSKECILSLQETAHYSLGLREFHISRSCSILGSTLAQPRGEINTPAGPRKCVRVCARAPAYVRACARVHVYTQLCFFSDTYSRIPSPQKLVDPGIVLISLSVRLQDQLL